MISDRFFVNLNILNPLDLLINNFFNFLCCSFCCGMDYHAPTDCKTIKMWLTKCADDSETANYISAHTKDVNMFMFIIIVIDINFKITIYVSSVQNVTSV